LFGATAPLVKHFGAGGGSFATAAILYAGAALGAGAFRSGSERRLGRSEAGRLVLVAAFGALLAPAALAWGLQHTSAVAASLLLNLEALFTVVLARVVYREPAGTRVTLAVLSMLAGGTLLALRGGPLAPSEVLGLGAVGLATLFWGLDNTLGRILADFDPRAVVFWKALLGATLASGVAFAAAERWPEPAAFGGLLACGAAGYGVSLRLYLRAQRAIGAARTGSLFAVAPFVGAALAIAFGDHTGLGFVAVSAALFAFAVYLHVTEQHHHFHVHDPLEHEHAHRHDDGHHDHAHAPPVRGSHSHPHRHEQVAHEHPHGDDLHHRHGHR
jgi:drug/metabolite transporter (DMT)-like permease